MPVLQNVRIFFSYRGENFLDWRDGMRFDEEALELMRACIHIRGEWMDENIDSLMQYASESKNKKLL